MLASLRTVTTLALGPGGRLWSFFFTKTLYFIAPIGAWCWHRSPLGRSLWPRACSSEVFHFTADIMDKSRETSERDEREALQVVGITDLKAVSLESLSQTLDRAKRSSSTNTMIILTIYTAWLRENILHSGYSQDPIRRQLTKEWCLILASRLFDKGLVLGFIHSSMKYVSGQLKTSFTAVKMDVERSYSKIRAPVSDKEQAELRLRLPDVFRGAAWSAASTKPATPPKAPSQLPHKPLCTNKAQSSGSSKAELPVFLTGANQEILAVKTEPPSIGDTKMVPDMQRSRSFSQSDPPKCPNKGYVCKRCNCPGKTRHP
jgi:hypothetical protein